MFDRSSSADEDEDLELLLDFRPDVIGLSAFLWNLPRIVRLVSRLRLGGTSAVLVVGGPSAVGFEDLACDGSRPDLLVIGYGEQTFANLLDAVSEGRLDESLGKIGNVVSYRGGRPERFGCSQPPDSLDSLTSPYLDGLVDLRGRSTIYIETDRGCPYSCSFCIESTAPPKVARFSIARIETELIWALARGIRYVELCSAIFNLDTDWVREFVTMVERVDPRQQMSFSAALFATHMNEEQAELFGRLRMKSALFGLNSVNPATFKDVRRVIRPEAFREKIAIYARRGRPQVSLIMGLPGDTPNGLKQTLAFAETLPADVMLFRFMVLAGTIYYERREPLKLEIDFAHGNRILSTYSYDRADFERMEAIAASAGFDEVNPGEWVRRADQERFRVRKPMSRRKWNLLYRILRSMQMSRQAWPGGARYRRVFLEVLHFAGVSFEGPGPTRTDIYVYDRDDEVAALERSRFFSLTLRDRTRRPTGGAPAEPDNGRSLLGTFAAAFRAAEIASIEARGSAAGGGGSAGSRPE
ncbi:radical SAM protein [Candidatus Binatia bacterium]|nr:radical SAM protein [Candidatus Binatia bacterium]